MERKFVELYPSLGLLTLGAYLRAHATDVAMVDLTFERDARPVDRRSGRSGRTSSACTRRPSRPPARSRSRGAFVRQAGSRSPAARTRRPVREAYLEAGFDAVVPAEGEAALVEVARRVRDGVPVAHVPGVMVRSGGRLVRGPSRPFLANLDDLPLPAWDLVDMEGYLSRWEKETGERRAAVLTSRGCPFDCSWCSKPTFGRTFRQQSPERVVEELVELKRRFRVDYVRFCDDVFGVSRPWIEHLLDLIDREGPWPPISNASPGSTSSSRTCSAACARPASPGSTSVSNPGARGCWTP